jgi:hypothetical protein
MLKCFTRVDKSLEYEPCYAVARAAIVYDASYTGVSDSASMAIASKQADA